MDLPAHDSRSLLSRLLTVLGLLVVAASLVWLITADGDENQKTGSTTSTIPPTTAAPSTSTTTTTTVPIYEQVLTSLIGGMSLRDKALQLLVVGGPGTDLIPCD